MHDLYSCHNPFSCSLSLTCGLVSSEDDHAVVFAPAHVLLNAAYDAAFQHYHPTAMSQVTYSAYAWRHLQSSNASHWWAQRFCCCQNVVVLLMHALSIGWHCKDCAIVSLAAAPPSQHSRRHANRAHQLQVLAEHYWGIYLHHHACVLLALSFPWSCFRLASSFQLVCHPSILASTLGCCNSCIVLCYCTVLYYKACLHAIW